MYLARIDGTLTAIMRHETLAGYQLLIGRRLDAASRQPTDCRFRVQG